MPRSVSSFVVRFLQQTEKTLAGMEGCGMWWRVAPGTSFQEPKLKNRFFFGSD